MNSVVDDWILFPGDGGFHFWLVNVFAATLFHDSGAIAKGCGRTLLGLVMIGRNYLAPFVSPVIGVAR